MADIINNDSKSEIAESLSLSVFCMHRIGFSFDRPSSFSSYFCQKLLFIISTCSICYHVFSESLIIGLTLWKSPRVEDVVPLIHTFGYGALSIAKVFVLWYKKNVFGQLLSELADIWPVPPLNEDAQSIKNKSLTALRIAHRYKRVPIQPLHEKEKSQEENGTQYVLKALQSFLPKRISAVINAKDGSTKY